MLTAPKTDMSLMLLNGILKGLGNKLGAKEKRDHISIFDYVEDVEVSTLDANNISMIISFMNREQFPKTRRLLESFRAFLR